MTVWAWSFDGGPLDGTVRVMESAPIVWRFPAVVGSEGLLPVFGVETYRLRFTWRAGSIRRALYGYEGQEVRSDT